MPAYDYRCLVCGREMEIIHRIADTITHQPHQKADDESQACDGELERLVSAAGYARFSMGTSAPSDSQLKNAGFTKYVKRKNGYEKLFGKD